MGDPETETRQAMVGMVRRAGVRDEAVLAAMAEVPRHRFVPAELRADAYRDMPLPIGHGQTISAAHIVGLMAAELRLRPRDTVLEVGTGSGYATAVMSRCCARVLTIEWHAELAQRARAVLAELGYHNVEVRIGDGGAGAPDQAPFQGIAVTAMAPGEIPPALVEQLAPGGTLLCPVGRGREGDLVRYRDGHLDRISHVGFVPLLRPEVAKDQG